jgi:deoxycytidylate deaminase
MTCAKQTVTCWLRPSSWHKVVRNGMDCDPVGGANACDNPQSTCPRAPGEGYEKCQTVCGQQGHAEIQALRHARELGIDVTGYEAHIYGHYYACEQCARALRDAGISVIHIYMGTPIKQG